VWQRWKIKSPHATVCCYLRPNWLNCWVEPPVACAYSLSYPSDQQTRDLKRCGRKIGRRVYYPASEVAQIIIGISSD